MFQNTRNKLWTLSASREEKQVNNKIENQNHIIFLNGNNEANERERGNAFKILREKYLLLELYQVKLLIKCEG